MTWTRAGSEVFQAVESMLSDYYAGQLRNCDAKKLGRREIYSRLIASRGRRKVTPPSKPGPKRRMKCFLTGHILSIIRDRASFCAVVHEGRMNAANYLDRSSTPRVGPLH